MYQEVGGRDFGTVRYFYTLPRAYVKENSSGIAFCQRVKRSKHFCTVLCTVSCTCPGKYIFKSSCFKEHYVKHKRLV